MPGARDGVGQVLIEREAVEAMPLHAVVSGQDAHQNLNAPENHHHEEILQRRALRWSGLEGQERILFRDKARERVPSPATHTTRQGRRFPPADRRS